MTISVTVPSLLADSIGRRTVDIEADTLAAALAALARHPKLGPLIFDHALRIRPHVLVFHNETATKHLPDLNVPLRPGDRLAVVQAVSGG